MTGRKLAGFTIGLLGALKSGWLLGYVVDFISGVTQCPGNRPAFQFRDHHRGSFFCDRRDCSDLCGRPF